MVTALRWCACAVLLVLVSSAPPPHHPPDACETMDPSHGGTSQPEPLPYEFYVNREVVPNRLSVHFAIKSKGSNKFAGFMVQARDDVSGIPVGEFDPGCVDIQVMTCFGVYANTAVHLNSEAKTEAHMRWLPDLNFVGNVTFHVTVAETRDTFWTCHPARRVQVVQEQAA